MVDDLNSCKREPEWVVVGYQVRDDTGKPVILVLTCCERHRVAVEKFQCTPVDAAMVVEIDALDFVMEGLMETGEVYTAAAVPA
jgi:hypothetical protein